MKPLIKLLTSIIFTLLIFTSCQPHRKENISSLQQDLDVLFASTPDFSGVLLIAGKGSPLYYKAFGYQNFETRVPLDTTSVFELASVSKQFTTMTIMMLKEEGKLNYDDPLENYITGLPYPHITIRHLLNHTSGLPDYQTVMDQYWDKTKVAGNAECIDYLVKYHPAKLFEPGEKYLYSNTGYMLLATIAEKASGHDFISFCKTRIFVPLEMRSTDIRTKEDKNTLNNMAVGHLFDLEKQRYIHADSFPDSDYTVWLGNRKGPGRISSTSGDLLKWDRALYTEKLIRKETLAEAFTPAKLNDGSLSYYGFGWGLENHPTLGKIVRHGGDNPGYKTHIIRYIDADKTVILLCNNAHERYPEVIKEIEEIVAKRE